MKHQAPMASEPEQMSGMELEALLDELTQKGQDDTPLFHRAYAVWEQRNDQ